MGLMKRYYRSYVLLLILAGVRCACADNPVVVLETNLGNIAVELYPAAAPVTVDNFLGYVNRGFYDNLIFHRVISGFMIQGGGYYLNGYTINPVSADLNKVTTAPIINESYNGLSNLRGTIAMARTGDPNSATSQFYINHADNLFLDKAKAADKFGYCVFGKVVEGLSAVDTIAQISTMYIDALLSDFPYSPPVVISRAYVRPCDSSYCSNFSSDIQVNFADFARFALRWLDNTCASANGFCGGDDLNYDKTVGLADLELFLDHWSRPVGYEPQYSNVVKDAQVNALDLTLLLSHWLDNGCTAENQFCQSADINHSGKVDLADVALFSGNWLLAL